MKAQAIPCATLLVLCLAADGPAAAQRGGLRATARPTKDAFGPEEAIAFDVTFTNVSNKPLRLSGYVGYRERFDYAIKDLGSGKEWRALPFGVGRRTLAVPRDIVLLPRAAHTVKAGGEGFRFAPAELMARRPRWPKVDIQKTELNLPAGRYRATIGVTLRRGYRKERYWTGRITAKPVEFEVAAEGSIAWGEPVNGLRAGIALDEDAHSRQGVIALTLYLRNVGTGTVRLLGHRWWERYGTPLFEVRCGGRLMKHQGPSAERDPPRGCYGHLGQGRTDSATVRWQPTDWGLEPPAEVDVAFVFRNERSEIPPRGRGTPRLPAGMRELWTGEVRSGSVQVEIGEAAGGKRTETRLQLE